MGKRQLSELQPFEFVITLILADLACVPMAEIPIPIIYGLIPIFSIFMLHILITVISVKSIKLRRIINGTPQIIVDKGSLCFDNIKKLGMHVSDILEGLRNKGFFSPLEVEFAIVETNGMMSVLPKSFSRPATPADLNSSLFELANHISNPAQKNPADVTIPLAAPSPPIALVMEGRLLRGNIANFGTDEKKVAALLKARRVNRRDVMLLTADKEKTVYLQPYRENFQTFTADGL
ncbi:MAG: DUF421 domain-containing protein [Clostridiales bacterium]|jgi:uncharacterized membrane protein YcaP (DUF421 family)|nr:DUF421 domain-containing protein [Clostridiales bacterium]